MRARIPKPPPRLIGTFAWLTWEVAVADIAAAGPGPISKRPTASHGAASGRCGPWQVRPVAGAAGAAQERRGWGYTAHICACQERVSLPGAWPGAISGKDRAIGSAVSRLRPCGGLGHESDAGLD